MNEKLDKTIDRIRKLLALAGNNDSQAQAEAALAKAQEIAIANGIDLGKIAGESSPEAKQDAEITCEYINYGQRLPTVSTYVNSILTTFFNVRIVLYGNRESGRGILFAGRRSDIETAKYISTWLSDTMVRCWHRYYEQGEHRGVKQAHKQSYLNGFHAGLFAKLNANKTTVENNLLPDANSRNQYALAVVNKEKAVDNMIGKLFPKLRKAPTRTIQHNSAAEFAGYREGQNCNIVKGGLGAAQDRLNA